MKPPVGSGLNKPATIKLHGCFPLDKATKEPITDANHSAVRRKIERLRNMPETRFIDYLPETGTWVFRVEHFSRYGTRALASYISLMNMVAGLDDDDDEEAAPEGNQAMEAEQQSEALESSEFSSEAEGDDESFIDEMVDEELPPAAMLGMLLSAHCFHFTYMVPARTDDDAVEDDDHFDHELSARTSRATQRLPDLLGLSTHRLQDMRSTFFGEGAAFDQPFPLETSRDATPALEGVPKKARIFEEEVAVLAPVAEPPQLSAADLVRGQEYFRERTRKMLANDPMHNAMNSARSFRAGWGPAGTLITADGSGRIIIRRLNPHAQDDALPHTPAVERYDSFVQEVLAHSDIQATEDACQIVHHPKAFRSFAGIIDIAGQPEDLLPQERRDFDERLIWELASALFDDIQEDGNDGAQDDAREGLLRSQRLSRWLQCTHQTAIFPTTDTCAM